MNVIVPIVATLFGGALTYLFNLRWRRTTRVEDLYLNAEAAVYEAAASVEYIWPVQPDHLNDDEYEQLMKWFVSESLKQWRSKVAEANLALSRLAAVCPDVQQFLPFGVTRSELPDPALLKLLNARKPPG